MAHSAKSPRCYRTPIPTTVCLVELLFNWEASEVLRGVVKARLTDKETWRLHIGRRMSQEFERREAVCLLMLRLFVLLGGHIACCPPLPA